MPETFPIEPAFTETVQIEIAVPDVETLVRT